MARCQTTIRGDRMKIVKFEEFHVDCGWEIYSFLKISTDEGLTGWSEFKEHRRPGIGAAIQGMGEILDRPGPARDRPHRGSALFLHPHGARAGSTQCGRRDPQCLPRHQRQGARRAGPRAVRRRGARPHAGLLVALRRDPRALRGLFRRQGDRQAGGAHGRRPQGRRARGARPRLQGGQNATCWCSTRTAAGSIRRAPRAGPAIPSSTCPRKCSTRSSRSSPRCARAAGRKLRIAVDLNFNYKTEGFQRIAKKLEPFDLMWLEMDSYEPRRAGLHPAIDHDADCLAGNHPRSARAEALSGSALRRHRHHRSAI